MGYVRGDTYRIVVGFDFSELGHMALHGAINSAMATPSSELHVLGVLSPRFGLGPVRGSDISAVDDVQALISTIVADAIESRGASELVTYYVHARVSGAPSVAIVELADEENADFIVIGTHGRHGVDRIVHGSTAEHVVRDASCPVLVVRRKVEHHELEAAELQPEPPCEMCLARRRATEGAEMWCDIHAHTASTSRQSGLARGSAVHEWETYNR